MNPLVKSTITITFGEQAENHVGMQKLGDGLAEEGFTIKELEKFQKIWEKKGCKTQLVNLKMALPKKTRPEASEAAILIIRNGVQEMTDADNFEDELLSLQWDTKALMYGRVVNKKARHNLCFGTKGQEPNYKKGKGRIVSFSDVPPLKKLRKQFGKIFGSKAKNMQAEGNLYYDASKCGIGFHGDSERKLVIGVRLGQTTKLCYQWYLKSKAYGNMVNIRLHHGDIYLMSEKATGHDWKKRSLWTLRHAAGSDKYTTLKKQ